MTGKKIQSMAANQQHIAIEYKELDDLIFDPKNPRIPSSLVKTSDEKEVINWMLTDAAILELMGSIGEKGFHPAEPLLVIQSHDNPGKFEVVEGNRRLTAAKLLSHPELAEKRKTAIAQIVQEAVHTPNELPVFVYPTREEILDYLGFKHITGVKPWSALAKAKYLKELQAAYSHLSIDNQYRNLAKAIGSRSDYVRDLLVGLAVYNKIAEHDYFEIHGLDEGNIEFGVYYTALSRSNIPVFLGIKKSDINPIQNINIDNLKQFTEWVSKKNSEGVTRLGESRNLTKLNAIVSSPVALEAFGAGTSLDDSLMLTEEPNVLFQQSVLDSLNSLKTANSYFHRAQHPKQIDLDNIMEISAISDNLSLLVNKKMSKDKSSK